MLLQVIKMHNQKKNVLFLSTALLYFSFWFHCQQNFWSISIINEPCCFRIESWASSANWTFCICRVCFSISCFRSFSSSFRSSCSFSDFFLSQPHWIIEKSQVKHHLFLCALGWYHSLSLPHSTFLHFFAGKGYLSLTDLVVTLKFISSTEFSTTAISSYNYLHSTLPCCLLHGCMCGVSLNRTMSWFWSHICWRLYSNEQTPY